MVKKMKCCCDCKHFRMWKPQPEYCTVLKGKVDPLQQNKDCYKLRKGLPMVNGAKT